jgi:hypothetical protein
MAIKYCKKCGSKNEYLGSTPKFCSSCGNSFLGLDNVSAQSSAIHKNSISSKLNQENLNEDETGYDYVPVVNKLSYTVNVAKHQTVKIEDLFPEINNDKTQEKGKT